MPGVWDEPDMTLPDIIPVFPLPNVVLFPQIVLPLHIFEPRYRDMVRDAARGPRLIGMALLREGWQPDYHGGPPIFTTGTVGEMVRMEELPDGRFNIVLRGLREFVIQRELQRRPYREAVVAWHAPLAGPLPPGLRKGITALVRLYIERLGQEAGDEGPLGAAADDETFVNFFAHHLDVSPVEKQALLEAPTLAERAARLRDVLEFRLEELRMPPGAAARRTH
ncbi:MAG: ATP-dependent protease [Deltaproteobacteria bacterium]|nr:MAG: ATP-dependent protease [Deltaproteobacteria bacterium]